MFNKAKSFCKRHLAASSGAAAATVSAVPAFATDPLTIDYTGITTGITTQLQTAVTAALPVLGVIMGVYLGVKIYRKFAK